MRGIVEPAQVGAAESCRLELALEERDRRGPDAIELAAEAFGLQQPHALERHRLDVRIVVALLASRPPVAHGLVLKSTMASA
jgi:hypothetical protein